MQEEEKRHRCEVRDWLRRRAGMAGETGKSWLRKVLSDIKRIRGEQAAERLRNDIVDQWQKGSRGALGDWR